MTPPRSNPENVHVIGYPTEWRALQERLPGFAELAGPLGEYLAKALVGPKVPRAPADWVVLQLGRVCYEEFREIYLLAGNGCGFAALKILRGMYERAVTLAYIAENQDQADSFIEFHHVRKHQLYEGLLNAFPEDPTVITKEAVEDLKAERERVKARFTIPAGKRCCACKKCKACMACEKCTTRLNHSWSRLDILSMAKKVGQNIDRLYLPCYLVPTMHAHATVESFVERMVELPGDVAHFKTGPQREESDMALELAHNLMLFVAGVNIKYFNLELKDEEQEAMHAFVVTWGKPKTSAAGPEADAP